MSDIKKVALIIGMLSFYQIRIKKGRLTIVQAQTVA
jgi:hypothetical protein